VEQVRLDPRRPGRRARREHRGGIGVLADRVMEHVGIDEQLD
jgi:hypothetical protein